MKKTTKATKKPRTITLDDMLENLVECSTQDCYFEYLHEYLVDCDVMTEFSHIDDDLGTEIFLEHNLPTLPKRTELIEQIKKSKHVEAFIKEWAEALAEGIETAIEQEQEYRAERKEELEEVQKLRKEEEEEDKRYEAEQKRLAAQEAKLNAKQNKAQANLIKSLSEQQKQQMKEAFGLAL